MSVISLYTTIRCPHCNCENHLMAGVSADQLKVCCSACRKPMGRWADLKRHGVMPGAKSVQETTAKK